jgi:hypothetical protein
VLRICVAWSFREFACCRSDLLLSMLIASLCWEWALQGAIRWSPAFQESWWAHESRRTDWGIGGIEALSFGEDRPEDSRVLVDAGHQGSIPASIPALLDQTVNVETALREVIQVNADPETRERFAALNRLRAPIPQLARSFAALNFD